MTQQTDEVQIPDVFIEKFDGNDWFKPFGSLDNRQGTPFREFFDPTLREGVEVVAISADVDNGFMWSHPGILLRKGDDLALLTFNHLMGGADARATSLIAAIEEARYADSYEGLYSEMMKAPEYEHDHEAQRWAEGLNLLFNLMDEETREASLTFLSLSPLATQFRKGISTRAWHVTRWRYIDRTQDHFKALVGHKDFLEDTRTHAPFKHAIESLDTRFQQDWDPEKGGLKDPAAYEEFYLGLLPESL